MKVLTKENFWDDIKNKYPNAFNSFEVWIDEYKKSHNWKILFNEGTLSTGNTYYKAPKFHQLPTAFQFGICLQCFYEMGIAEAILPGSSDFTINRLFERWEGKLSA